MSFERSAGDHNAGGRGSRRLLWVPADRRASKSLWRRLQATVAGRTPIHFSSSFHMPHAPQCPSRRPQPIASTQVGNRSRARYWIWAARVGVTASIALAVLTTPHRAAADTTSANDDGTKELVRKGFVALKKNDLEAARQAFAEAWRQRQHFAIALSLAEVEMRLGLFLDAAEHWHYVLANLPDDLAEKRTNVQEQLAECKAHIGTVTLRVKPDGAAIFIDGKRVADAPLNRELYLSPADHDVYAEKGGQRSPTRSFRTVAGSKLSFELVVQAPPSAQAPSATPAATPRLSPVPRTAASEEPLSASSSRTAVLVSGAVLTVASAAFGTAYVLKSNAAGDDAESAFQRAFDESDPRTDPSSVCAIEERPRACDDATDRLSDQVHFRNVAIAGFVATGVFAVATATTYLLWPNSGRTAPSPHVLITPSLAPRFAGVAVTGRF